MNLIRTKEEILASIRERVGEDASDEVLSLLEDVTDTITDLETKAKGDGKDWKAEAERIDADWRKKYHDRFFSGEKIDDPVPDDPGPDSVIKMSFDDLFEVKE